MANPELYVSYNWCAENEKPIVDKLEAACRARGITLNRDVHRVGYGDSIRAFMTALGAGDHIVIVLSDSYLRSEHCLYELREIERNGNFRSRMSPIVLRGTAIHKAVDRVLYLRHWEQEIEALETAFKDVGRANTTNISEALDNYTDFRRLMDGYLATLADMNTLTDDIHVDSDFDAILNRFQPSTPQTAPVDDGKFKSDVAEEIRKILDGCKDLLDALWVTAERVGRTDANIVADDLCAKPFADAVDLLLRPAAIAALTTLAPSSRSGSDLWIAATDILMWVSLLLFEHTLFDANAAKSARIVIGVRTRLSVELVSARNRRMKPQLNFQPGKADIAGAQAMEDVTFETGWNEELAVEAVLATLWKRVFPEDPRLRLSADDKASLNATLVRVAKYKTHNHYISVAPEQDSALKRPEVYRRLIEQLPAATVIYFATAAGTPFLAISDEHEVVTIVREFFNLPNFLGNPR